MGCLCGIALREISAYREIEPTRKKDLVASAGFITLVPFSLIEVSLSLVARTFTILIPWNADRVIQWKDLSIQTLRETCNKVMITFRGFEKRDEPQVLLVEIIQEVSVQELREMEPIEEMEILPSQHLSKEIEEVPVMQDVQPAHEEETLSIYDQYVLGSAFLQKFDILDELLDELPFPNEQDQLELKRILVQMIVPEVVQAEDRNLVEIAVQNLFDPQYVSPTWQARALKILWRTFHEMQREPLLVTEEIRQRIQGLIFGNKYDQSLLLENFYDEFIERKDILMLDIGCIHQLFLNYDITHEKRVSRDLFISLFHGEEKLSQYLHYYRSSFNELRFNLPPALLCVEHRELDPGFIPGAEQGVFKNFEEHWKIERLVQFFMQILCVEEKGAFLFKKEMFEEWLMLNGLERLEDPKNYEPQLLLNFLEDYELIARKE